MTTSHDELIERIQKCLALAGSPNLNEAAAAMEMAQKLMTQYNIALYEVEAHTGKPNEDIATEDFDLGVGRGAPANWLRDLVFSISRHNFCKGLAYTGQRRMTIVGEPHNIEIVKFFYGYLTREINRLADEGYEKSEAKTIYPRAKRINDPEAWYWSSRSWKNAFRVAAVQTIDTRLWTLRRNLDQSSTALVTAKDAKVKAHVTKLFPNLGKHEGSTTYSLEGDSAGYAAANSIPLNVPVDTSSTSGNPALRG